MRGGRLTWQVQLLVALETGAGDPSNPVKLCDLGKELWY